MDVRRAERALGLAAVLWAWASSGAGHGAPASAPAAPASAHPAPASAHPAPAPFAWDERFLSAPPREVAAAAKDVDDPEAGIVVLFEERLQTFEADGRSRSRYRRAYKVLTQAAVEDGGVGIGWAPWHEEQPVIRARVVTREGKAFVLDPKTIEASGVKAGEPDMFTDRRELRAPLPGLARGAVVEEELTVDSRPIVAGLGTSDRYFLGGFVPVRRTRLVLEAPAALPLRYLVRPAGAFTPVRSEKDGRVRLVFEAGPLAASPLPDEGWPDEVPVVPSVRYTTGPPWREVAARYGDIVDRQLAGADVKTWVKEARAGLPGRPSRAALAARLLARLHRDVRYTGVEFGDASIVPRPPGEVLARGYGDCKDQAALLVALLRAAGIAAHVALLHVEGSDADPALPAFDGFDHAIVYLPPAGRAEGAVWIDPTDPYAPLGELPGSDVNRHALVVAPGADGLVVTPLAAAGQSRVRELRRILLDESGHPHVVERTEGEGAAGRAFRHSWSTAEHKTLEEQLTAYVKEQYAAKALARFDVGTPADVSRPPVLELEATDAEIAAVWDAGAEVVVRSSETLDRLPPHLRSDKDEPPPAKPRTVDYVIPEPYVHELRYEIVPPHGFSPDPLPTGGTRALGTASLRSSYAFGTGGSVVASFVFDSGKPRLTPAELGRFREDVKAYLAQNAPVVRFHADGVVALASGRVRDALTTFRRLDAEHPHQALHARQIAEALLAAGLGQPARDEAKRAVAADPKSADGERVLGWTLEHDLVGRRFGTGADLKGAEAAYRRAVALDPKNRVSRASLAILLEHDATGQRSFPAAVLPEVERLYAELEKEGEKAYGVNHLLVLLYQQRFREVIDRARGRSNSSAENMIVLAAMAATQGTAAALREAASRIPDDAQRAEAVRGAGAELLRLRRYPESAALYEQAARDLSNGPALRTFAERVRRAKRRETVALDPRRPADLAKALFIELFATVGEGRSIPPATIARLAAPELAKSLDPRALGGEARMMIKTLARSTGGVPMSSLADLIVGQDFTVEGQPNVGYRVRMPGSGRAVDVLIGPQPEGLRVVSMSTDRVSAAAEALRLARAGRLEAARTWLDWLLEDESLGNAGEPLSGSMLARVWTHDDAARGAADAELAAAVVIAAGPRSTARFAEALPILERARATATTEPRRIATLVASIDALSAADRAAEAYPLAVELHGKYPRSIVALGHRLDLLQQLGRLDEAVKLAAAEAAARPREPQLQRMWADAQVNAGRLAESEATFTQLAGSPNATPHDYNMEAWLRLCRGDVGEGAVAAARRGVELSSRQAPGILHTLAALQAERDEPERARETLIESLEQRASDDLTDADRYVLGRIAESYGLPETAEDLYRHLERPSRAVETSSYVLAQRRLGRLVAARGGRAPTQAKATGPKATEPKATAAKATEAKATEAKPAEAKATEAKPSSAKGTGSR